MKSKSINHILIFLFAAYFLLVGVGYNVVNYCCNSCAEVGIEEVAINSCTIVHHEEESSCCEHESNDLTCNNIHHQPSSCHLLRLNIDIPSIQTYSFSHQINSVDLFFPTLLFSVEHSVPDALLILRPPESHLPSSGRYILAFNAVLLI